MPCGLCTSSATVGHSLSLGKTDAVTIVAETATLADAVATATANQITRPTESAAALEWAVALPGVLGAVAIIGETLAAAGEIQLTRTDVQVGEAKSKNSEES